MPTAILPSLLVSLYPLVCYATIGYNLGNDYNMKVGPLLAKVSSLFVPLAPEIFIIERFSL